MKKESTHLYPVMKLLLFACIKVLSILACLEDNKRPAGLHPGLVNNVENLSQWMPCQAVPSNAVVTFLKLVV